MPRAKAQSSLAKNQMQLAIALSSSLEESKKQELSKLTEELPASTIEDGDVPQNIKRMQKEFLERLQLPKPGPSRKSKKPPKPVPTLLVQSCEERLRILTEKVSLVLIKEDGILSPSKNEDRLTLLHDDCQENGLWNMSWMLSSDNILYYTDCLATFIPPSEVTIGSKLNNAIVVPRRLTTPVKYRALPPNDSSQFSPHTGQEISSDISNEANFVDPYLETRLELQNDWQKLLNNSELSDVTIIVKEGSYIWAHKLVLFVRCRAAVDDLDVDNKLFWTNVTHCHAIAFLEYVYSGKLTAIHMLGASVEGVLLLARKYKVTELFKHLPISDLAEEVSAAKDCNESISNLELEASDSNDCIVSTPIATPKKTFCPSPDIFDSPQRIINKEKVTTPSNNPICDYIEVSSDEEVKLFFGTCNPTVISPTIESDPESEIDLKEQKTEVTKQLTHNSDIDMFSSFEGSASSSKCCLLSPERSRDKTHFVPSTDLQHIEILSLSDRLFKKTINADVITESKSCYSSSQRTRQSSLEISLKKNHISENAKEHHSSLLSTPRYKKRKQSYIDDKNQYCKAIRENISTDKLSPVDSPMAYSSQQSQSNCFQYSFNDRSLEFKTKDETKDKNHISENEDEHSSNLLSTPCYKKRKQSYIDEMNQSRKAICENVPTDKLSPVYSPMAYSSQPSQSDCFQYSLNDRSLELKTKDEISPNKLLVQSPSERSFPLLKRQTLSSSTNDCEKEKNLFDDSFKFDINDSELMRQPDNMQTPESKSLRLGLLRTPLDNVKSSHPATPMPDYDAMTDEQYQMELERYGLKKGLPRRKGIKMLTHIYGKLHPLVEVVSLDGKKLHIPLGEKTPGYEVSADDEQLSQQSVGSSGDEGIMLEETIFDDEEEDLTPGVSSYDLNTAVRTWITSQPEIHEMILSYEPIWVDSFHLELKKQFDKKIKVNQLMDVLDEEGITFRSAQGQQNRRKKQSSPKKKRVSPKKQLTSPKTK